MGYVVQALGSMSIDVPDLDRAIDEAQNVLGLRTVHKGDGVAVLTSNARRVELVYHASRTHDPSGRVRAIGLEAYNEDGVRQAARRAEDVGWAIVSRQPSAPMIDASVTFATEEGLVFEVHTPIAEDQPVRYATSGVRPRKLDHVGPKTTDTARLARQLHDVLGLQVSDRTSGDELAFMRAGNGQHHTCSLIKGEAPGLHHYAWAFWRFNDFLSLGDALDTADQQLVFGPGRHGPGDNLYTYHLDRNGVMVECCTEMEIINHEEGFQTRTWDIANPRLINRWGVAPPKEWLEHNLPFATVRS